MMKRRGFLTGTAALAALPSVGRTTLAASPLSLPDMPLHDPWIVADATTQTYWLFTSNVGRMSGERGVGVMAYRSQDLKHWTKPEVVFRLPQGIWANAGCWAPEVHLWRGKWYLFVTVHNEAMAIPGDGNGSGQPQHRRSTILAASDTLDGPFTVVRDAEPVVSKDLMTLDGTLYVDPEGKPWMVYAHEWVQMRVGTMEAVPLDDGLRAIGEPRLLFRGSDSPHAVQQQEAKAIVTDGPQLYRTSDGTLYMLWSSWGADGYIQTIARSTTGDLMGPWQQLPLWLGKGSGHGMMFRTFENQWMLVVHRPFKNARGKLYEVRDTGSAFELIKQRVDLDLDPEPLPPYKL